MQKIVYFGNKTSSFKLTKSTLETLEPLFSEFVEIHTSSHKKNKLLRIIDMIASFMRYSIKSDFILIDVYSTSAFYFALIIGILSRIFRKKYILILHGGNLPNRFKNKPKTTKFLFNQAYKIVAPSHYLKTFFESNGYKVIYIPNTIEINQYNYKKRNFDNYKILGIRGFQKNYNPLMAIKAIHILKTKLPNISLTLLGDSLESEYNNILNYIKQYDLENHISILPKMPKKEWIKFSEDFDIMISTPIIDNTPVSVIEGMALGLCIISTNVGGIPYLVENKKEVILIDSDDHKALADTIDFIFSNQDVAKEIAALGRKKAEEFDWNNVKTKWVNLFSTI